MQVVLNILDWVKGPNGVVLVGVLLAVSEALALIPAIKANSILQAVVNGLKWVKAKLSPAVPPQA